MHAQKIARTVVRGRRRGHPKTPAATWPQNRSQSLPKLQRHEAVDAWVEDAVAVEEYPRYCPEDLVVMNEALCPGGVRNCVHHDSFGVEWSVRKEKDDHNGHCKKQK